MLIRAPNRKWVCALHPPPGIVADREVAMDWEWFIPYDAGDGAIALKTRHGKWLCAEEADGLIIGNRDRRGDWERFWLEVHGGYAAFRSFHGRYWSVKSNGALYADSASVGPNELFVVMDTFDAVNDRERSLLRIVDEATNGRLEASASIIEGVVVPILGAKAVEYGEKAMRDTLNAHVESWRIVNAVVRVSWEHQYERVREFFRGGFDAGRDNNPAGHLDRLGHDPSKPVA